jgi:DDE family transposase
VESTAWSKDLAVEVAGQGVVSHTGSAMLRLLADGTGLTGALSKALRRRGFSPVHDRGRVLADTAVLIADGGTVMSDLATLRDQGELFGPVASNPTLWRTLNEVGSDQRDRIGRARAKVRVHVWGLICNRHGRIPPSQVADKDLGDTVVIRMDASILISHSDKELAAGTFKHTWGHHPLTAWCDNTGESLAFRLRPGNAGSNTASDHIAVLDEAIAQIPARHRRDLLVTVDGAGATLDLVRHLTTLNAAPGRQVHYSVGFDLDERARGALGRVPARAWQAVSDTEGQARDLDDAGVVELTGLLRRSIHGDLLANWPTDMRVICRRERPSAGAQLSLLEEADGWRYQLIATNTPTGQLAFLEARHRAHARVEDRIRCGKDTGIDHLPSTSFAINQAWCVAAMIAADLLCWLRLLCLDGPLARAEPKTLRYHILHTAARLVRGQRKRKIKIPQTWPWAHELEACFLTAFALNPP